MTLTQVSTWFANARRRLKKDNKVTWAPRSKPGEDSDDENMDENGGSGDEMDSSRNEHAADNHTGNLSPLSQIILVPLRDSLKSHFRGV